MKSKSILFMNRITHSKMISVSLVLCLVLAMGVSVSLVFGTTTLKAEMSAKDSALTMSAIEARATMTRTVASVEGGKSDANSVKSGRLARTAVTESTAAATSTETVSNPTTATTTAPSSAATTAATTTAVTTAATTTSATTATTAAATTATTTLAPAGKLSNEQWCSEIFRLTNLERIKAGLPEFAQGEPGLYQAAGVRAKEISISFSHVRPDGTSFYTAIAQCNVSFWTAGENIAKGSSGMLSPAKVVELWMNSPGHRANILNPGFTILGTGYDSSGGYDYCVQLFTNPY